MKLKPIAQWSRVFFDTSVIIDYLKDPEQIKDELVSHRVRLAHEVIDFLAKHELEDGKRRQYYVSSITVAELIRLANNNTYRSLAVLFPSSDLYFVDFTAQVAELMKKSIVDAEEMPAMLQRLRREMNEDHVQDAKYCIIDDVKIVACAKSIKKLDVVLTSDTKSFIPIAQAMQVPAISMHDDFLPRDLFGEIAV